MTRTQKAEARRQLDDAFGYLQHLKQDMEEQKAKQEHIDRLDKILGDIENLVFDLLG